MKLNFKVEYQTAWGEELKLVIGDEAAPMHYNAGGIWTATVTAGRTAKADRGDFHLSKATAFEYHYEVWKDGGAIRREWRNRTVKPAGDADFNDKWMDIPASAPFYTSAFASGTLSKENPEDLFHRGWKCAGMAVPVFSLRTKDSFGCGEFHDIKALADWAASMGMRVIQVLPINDTTMTGTWTDCYPYSANSIYALHPQFIHLPDTGVSKDKAYKQLQQELEALPQIDYERVNREKDRLMRKSFKKNGAETLAGKEYKKFYEDNEFWLKAYCAFRILTAKHGTGDPAKWGEYAQYSDELAEKVISENRGEADYHAFVQFHLHKQLIEARDYAHSKGIILKGDLPIGVSRTSVDAWQNPSQFRMDSCAGAPPDAFAADGQNWGFPTYNWEKMAEDNYAWWKARLKNMEQYFDAFRIDHVLGFFRIWEIPLEAKSGLMGHFNPSLPYAPEDLKAKGFDIATGLYTDSESLDTLFIEDPHRKGWWHPRISAQNTSRYNNLPWHLKDSFNALYDDYYYRRHNEFWRRSAMRKLPELLASTGMLACGEDLGMIPACVPETMQELKILSLEIQRMPKDVDREFTDTWKYPYFSVCATSTHDMNPIRAWWKEDRNATQRFWNCILGQSGPAPEDCTPDICRSILMMHLQSASMLCILPLQDYLSIRPDLCFENPEDERINIPAITPYYWRFRMKGTIEDLAADSVTDTLRDMIADCGRE